MQAGSGGFDRVHRGGDCAELLLWLVVVGLVWCGNLFITITIVVATSLHQLLHYSLQSRHPLLQLINL